MATLTVTPILAAVLLAVVLPACNGAQDCSERQGEPADRCWAERATDASLTGEQRHQAALEVGEPALRDLAIAQAATGLGLDACDPISDPQLRDSCQARTRRPHLDIPEPPEHAAGHTPTALGVDAPDQRAAIERAETACAGLPSGLVDLCKQRQASQEDATVGWVVCTTITDPDLQGDCSAQAATRLGAAEQAVQAAAVCGALEDPRWRGECSFRTSEALPLSRLEDSAEACIEALGFEDECFEHLVQRKAQSAALRARFGDADETMSGMASDLERLDRALGSRPAAPWLRRLFWYEAFHALLAQAHYQQRLGEVITQGQAALEGDPRGSIWADCATKLCARARAETADSTAPMGLDALAAPCGLLQGEPPSPTLLPSAGTGRGSLATSEVPAPIQPAAGCEISPDARTVIAALWGLEQLDWAHSQPQVELALAHSEPTVRAYTLDMVEHKAFFWQRQDRSGQLWLAQRLEALAQEDPSHPIQQRASVLATALTDGERPGRWAFHSSGMCAGGRTEP